MFKHNNDLCFFTNESSEWFNNFEKNYSGNASIASACEDIDILSNSDLPDADVAAIIFKYWNIIFNNQTYMREDGVFKFIESPRSSIEILSAARTKTVTAKNKTGKLFIQSLH